MSKTKILAQSKLVMSDQLNSDRQMFGIQFCSDLHLEFNPDMAPIDFSRIIEPKAPVLALLGDIGCPLEAEYQNFLAYVAARFQLVFVIAGNHEYYNDMDVTKEEVDAKIDALCRSYPNVIFLQNRSYTIWDAKTVYRIIGTTLWSQVPEEHQAVVARRINDYKLIRTNGPGSRSIGILTPAITNEWHQQAVHFLQRELIEARAQGQVPIVLTHHVPLLFGTSHTKHNGEPTSSAFASDLSTLIEIGRIKYWLCGHTHHNFNIACHGTLVTSNQLGYGLFKGYAPQRGFRTDRVLPL